MYKLSHTRTRHEIEKNVMHIIIDSLIIQPIDVRKIEITENKSSVTGVNEVVQSAD